MPTTEDPKHLRRLLDAVLSVGAELSLSVVLQRIAEAATELVDARYGALGVLDDTGSFLSEFITTGLSDDQRATIGRLPEGHGILGLLIVDPRPLRLPDLSQHPDSYGFPPGHPPMTTFLGVPIRVRDRVFGNLYLCDKSGGGPFTDLDEELAVALAAAAGVAVENARLHERVADLALAEERDRIARDLHDTVIQRLFAAGLGLQSLARRITDPEVQGRLEAAVDDLDTTVRQIRSTIFELQTSHLPGRAVRAEVLELAADASRALGFEPDVHFDGPIDAAVGPLEADHLLAVAREALSNVARHAGATRASIDLTCRERRLDLVVTDDGRGTAEDRPGGRGLANMKARATRLAGTFEVTANPSGGTTITWSIPIRDL